MTSTPTQPAAEQNRCDLIVVGGGSALSMRMGYCAADFIPSEYAA